MLKPLPGIEYKINLRQKNNHFDHGHWNLGCSGEGKSISLVSDEKNCRKSLPGIEYKMNLRKKNEWLFSRAPETWGQGRKQLPPHTHIE